MRVGVHTGTVLCGIVGTKRFKFDVWSNDVSFANKMESSGKPGRVHISEETSGFLGGSYVLEEGEEVFGEHLLRTRFSFISFEKPTRFKNKCIYTGHKTYFIEGRQLYSTYERDQCLTPSIPINLRLIISPAVSPQSILSFTNSHTPVPSKRSSTSGEKRRPESNNFLSPGNFHFRTKASSLPSILDSDGELDDKRDKSFPERTDSSSKSPTSVGKLFQLIRLYRFVGVHNKNHQVITRLYVFYRLARV